MPDHEYDLENEFSHNLNDTTTQKGISTQHSEAPSSDLETSSKGLDDLFKPQLSPEEQQKLTDKRNSSEFQMGLQEMLPKNQPKQENDKQGGLQGVIQQWQQKKKNTTGIPDNIKKGIESLSGISLDDVTVHYNSAKPAEYGAHAYTEGTDVYIAPGMEDYLPHELWHVIQQKQGRVKPTKTVKGKKVNDKPSLEDEAETGTVKKMQFQGTPSSDVIQRVTITIPDWGDEETTNQKNMIMILEMVKDGDITLNSTNETEILAEYKRGTYDANGKLVGLVKEYFKLQDEEDTTDYDSEMSFEDSQTWQQEIGGTGEEQFRFLQSVVDQTRTIIPVAINRAEERPHGQESPDDMLNRKFMCQQKIIKDFSFILKQQEIIVANNYIHPAALERIMLLVDETASELQSSSSFVPPKGDTRTAGICKDFASIAYGLIKQNDPRNVLNARFGFIKDHVFVEADIEGDTYVVDAWRTAGKRNGVLPKSEHIANLNDNPKPEYRTYRDYDDSTQEQDSASDNPLKQKYVDEQYEKAPLIYKLWRKNEARYKKLAAEFLAQQQDTYIVTGKF